MCCMYHELNEKAKLRLLRYANAEVLDYIGERVKCERLGKRSAISVERYKIATPLNINVPIPKGSTVTPDGTLIFETTEAAVILAGELYVDVPIKSQNGGSIYNGFAPGSINTQVSNVPYISSVENIEISYDGDDGEPYPQSDKHPDGDDGSGDNNYRERIRKAPASFSTAGPGDAYEYFALSADASIEDAKVSSNHEAGRVDITVTVKDDKIPSEEILKKVLENCSSKDRRPLNDEVHASGPAIKKYDIDLKYYTTEDTDNDAVIAIENKGGAIDEYIKWQSLKINRDINPDKLKNFLMNAGAKRVEIKKPVFADLDFTSEAITSYSVTNNNENVFYVSQTGQKGSHVTKSTEIYEDKFLYTKVGVAEEGEYTYTGESFENPKGIGELALFSGNLNVNHSVEDE